MKNFFKIFSWANFLVLVFLVSFNLVLAAVEPPDLKVDLGPYKIDFSDGCTPVGDDSSRKCQINWIGEYIAAVYRYGIGLAAVLAVVMIMAAGFVWVASAGNSARVKTAQEMIMNSLAGLSLALFSYVILQTINPRLVSLDPLEIDSVKNVALRFTENAEVPNQACEPPFIFYSSSQSEGSGEGAAVGSCSIACETAGGFHEVSPIFNNQAQRIGYCCACRNFSNECLTLDQGSCQGGDSTKCCPGLICNTFLRNECKRPGKSGDYCNYDNECLPGTTCNLALITPTSLLTPLPGSSGGQCCGRMGVGGACGTSSDCASGLSCNPCGMLTRARCTRDTSPDSPDCGATYVSSCPR